MFKVWLIVLIFDVSGSTIVDVQRIEKPFESHDDCDRAKPRAMAKLNAEGKNYIIFCRGSDREV